MAKGFPLANKEIAAQVIAKHSGESK
jgi:hypothetical protein